MDQIQPQIGNLPFLVFVAILIIAGIAQQTERERLSLFLRSFINGNLVDQQLRQERAFSKIALLSFLFVLLTISTFLTICAHHFGLLTDFSFIGLFATIGVTVFLITTLRVAVYTFFSWLFKLDKLQQQHSYHWLLVNLVGCLALLPLTILISYGPVATATIFAYAGLIVLALISVLRLTRFFIISTTRFSVSITYNFIYICALEILPLWLTTTVILRQIGG